MNDCKNFGIRLDDGAALPLAVEQLADQISISFCDVSGFGELEWVELAMDDHGTVVQRFDGPLQLINLKGRLRLAGTVVLSDFVCTLSRQTDNGIQLLGGKLHQAFASFVELTFSPLFPLETALTAKAAAAPSAIRDFPTRELTRSASSPPPSSPPPAPAQLAPPPVFREPPRAAPAAPAPLPVVSPPVKEPDRTAAALDDRWAKAVLESKRLEAESNFLDDETDSRPHRGDIVHHMQFGECQVTRIDDDHITLRKPDGRNVQLGLTVLRFIPIGKRNGKDAFRVEIGKR